MYICLWWQGVSFIVVCWLETAAVDVSLSPAEMLQLFSISTVCVGLFCGLSVFFDGTAGCCYQATGPSVLCRNERITLARPAVFAPVFIRVYEKVCMHECFWITRTFQQSTLLYLKHTNSMQWSHTSQASICLCCVQFTTFTCSPISSLFHSLISFYFLFILHVFYLLPFSHLFLPTSSLSPFSCHPPALLLSHAPVGEHNKMAMAVLCIVCVCLWFSVWCHTTTAV